jgi:hypothetical protein
MFTYAGISIYAAFIDEKNKVKKIISKVGQAGRTVCLKCGKDATQVFEKCQACGCWKEHLTEGLCSSCFDKRIWPMH